MPLKDAVSYVAAAYIAVFLIVLVYVAIMAVRVRRTERELSALLEQEGDERRRRGQGRQDAVHRVKRPTGWRPV